MDPCALSDRMQHRRLDCPIRYYGYGEVRAQAGSEFQAARPEVAQFKKGETTMPLKEAYAKLDAAFHALACSELSLHDRLEAAIAEVTLLKAERDFPPDYRGEFHQLMDEIHTYRESGDRPDLQSSLASTILEMFKKLLSFTVMVK